MYNEVASKRCYYLSTGSVPVRPERMVMTMSGNMTSGNGDSDNGDSMLVSIDLYSVVLSVAGLSLCALLGGGGCITLLVALFRSPRQAPRNGHTLLLVLLLLSLALCTLWAPLELLHLLTFHLTSRHLTSDLPVATFALYVFLLGGMALLLLAFSLENVLRLSRAFRPSIRRAWPVLAVVVTLTSALTLALVVVAASFTHDSMVQSSYLVLDPQESGARVAVLTLVVVMVVVGAVGVVATVGVVGVGTLAVGHVAIVVKASDSFPSSHSHNSQSSNPLPPYTAALHQDMPGCSSDDCEGASVSPASSKIPDILEPEDKVTTPTGNGNNGNGGLRLHAMPTPPVSKGPTMLGVNMVQVLGRRRHTICQIGDSSTPPDPVSKARQYNYVRKFSVDISALQAQLENPKLFKDAPFQSDQDLAMRNRQQEKSKQARLPEVKPLLPLPNLMQPRLDPVTSTGGEGGGLKLILPSRPPVITVSEEVKEEEIEEEEEEEEVTDHNCSITKPAMYRPIVNKEELTDIPRLPVMQPVDDEDEDEDEDQVDRGEEECQEQRRLRDDGDDDSENQGQQSRLSHGERDYVKMTLLLCLTFVLCTFPLLLVEALKPRLSVTSYVNVCTCARALSAIQTILYPHVLLCTHQVTRRAVARLKVKASTACAIRDTDCMDLSHDHRSSLASQL